MPPSNLDIGMIGLGTMGRNLLLNIGDHRFSAAGYDKNPTQLDALRSEAGDRSLVPVASLESSSVEETEAIGEALGTILEAFGRFVTGMYTVRLPLTIADCAP